MLHSPIQNKTALVTGASSGLGVDFARQLARRGCNVILAARREDRLRQVAGDLQASYGAQTWIIPADLARPEGPADLYAETQRLGLQVDVLVNNAGFGLYGYHSEIAWEREREMLQVDVIAVAQLTKLCLPGMLQRDFGYILMVSSYGAFQPSPTYAAYSAAKSYVQNFGEALSYELRRSGVGVTVIAPGMVATGFHQAAGHARSLFIRQTLMPSSEVARIGVEAMLKRKPSVVPGWLNALLVFGNRFVPRRFSAWVVERLMTVGQK